MEDTGTIELRWILAVLRRWWWLVLIFALLGAGSAYAVTSRRPALYTSSVTLLIDKGRAVVSGDLNDTRASEQLAETYSQMLTSRPVMEATIAELGLRATPLSLASQIRVERGSSSQLIRLTVTDTDPARALEIAQVLPGLFVAQLQGLQAERYTGSLSQIGEQLDGLEQTVEETQASIDALRVKKIGRDTELARLQYALDIYQPEYQSLRQDYDALSLQVAQSTQAVTIVEAAQQPESTAQSPYTATVTLLVARDSSGQEEGQQMVNTYSNLLTGQAMLAATIAELDLEETTAELASRVRSDPVLGTQLIRLSVQDVVPARAALIANTLAQSFATQIQAQQEEQVAEVLNSMQERIDETSALIQNTQATIENLEGEKVEEEAELARLESELEEARDNYKRLQQSQQDLSLTLAEVTDNLLVIEEAQVSARPQESQWMSYTLLGAVFGATLALGLAMMVEYLNNKIRTPEDVRQALGLKTIGAIGLLPKRAEKLIAVAQPRSPITEAFRVLSTNVRFASLDRPTQVLLVTSPGDGEGKSMVAANLAVTLAEAGLSVVLVDADLHHAQLHKLFGLDGRQGLTDLFLEENLNGNLQPTELADLKVITGGPLPPNPSGMLGSQKMAEIVASLTEKADIVLIDSPPVLPVADTLTLAPAVDGVLLVLRAGRTRQQAARRAKERLDQVGAHLVGVVVNGVGEGADGYYYTAYDYVGIGRREQSFWRRLGGRFARRRKPE